jgi:O-antigen ligase
MTWTETHNIYLQSVVERGLPGLAVFLWLLAVMGRLLWRAARSGPPALGIFFGFVGLLFAGMTESWTNDSEVVMCFYFLAGTAWALGSRGGPVEKYEKKTIL